MSEQLTQVGLIGFGGFGQQHRRALSQLEEEGVARLAAVAEVNQAAYADDLKAAAERGVAIYSDWEEMLAAGGFDVVAVAAPLQWHRTMVVKSLESGYPVFCEKSAATTVQDVVAMAEASERTGLPVGIDFQLLSSDLVKTLKGMVAKGEFGTLRRIVGVGLLQRPDRYYERAGWAGKFKVGSRYALDGPMTNALAHMLNNMLYIASPNPGELAEPVKVRGEMYRAQPLPEMEDTGGVQLITRNNVEVFYLNTYCASEGQPHFYRIQGSKATAIVEHGRLTVERDGKTEVLIEKGNQGTPAAMYKNYLGALAGKETMLSAVGEALKLVRAQNGAYISSGRINSVPDSYFRRYEEKDTVFTVIDGLDKLAHECGERGLLYADAGAPWGRRTPFVDVTKLTEYKPESTENL